MRIPSTLLSSGHTRANKQKALVFEFLGTTDGIGIMRVSTIDDDIARLEMGNKLLDETVDGIPSLDEEDNLARTLELGSKLLDRAGANNIGA